MQDNLLINLVKFKQRWTGLYNQIPSQGILLDALQQALPNPDKLPYYNEARIPFI